MRVTVAGDQSHWDNLPSTGAGKAVAAIRGAEPRRAARDASAVIERATRGPAPAALRTLPVPSPWWWAPVACWSRSAILVSGTRWSSADSSRT